MRKDSNGQADTADPDSLPIPHSMNLVLLPPVQHPMGIGTVLRASLSPVISALIPRPRFLLSIYAHPDDVYVSD